MSYTGSHSLYSFVDEILAFVLVDDEKRQCYGQGTQQVEPVDVEALYEPISNHGERNCHGKSHGDGERRR